MKWILALLYVTMAAVSTASAGSFEFAMLTCTGKSVTWIDKSGSSPDADGSLFAQLSGEDRKLAQTPQSRVLILNGLSKKGWDLVDVRNTANEQSYLFKRDAKEAAVFDSATPATATAAKPSADGTHVPLVFTGGHDTDSRDGGRPVVLVAAGLGLEPQVFRDAFSHVHPAGPGSGGPTDAEARQNKHALMDALGKYGITDDDINTVSNFYRYASWKGDIWRNTPAAGYATVANGKVTGFVITTAGAGYTTPPTVTVQGMSGVTATATLSFGKDLATNGSIKEVTVDSGAKNP